jgi:nucleotide-binding universal stress UspA family protein
MTSRRDRTIVIGFDGSPGSRSALRWGLVLAERRGAPVHLIHALEPTTEPLQVRAPDAGLLADGNDQARDQFEATCSEVLRLHPRLEITAELVVGGAAAALTEQSRTAALVVIGAHGVRGFRSMVAGPTTMSVATDAQCTVVSVPTREDEVASGTGVIVGVDGSEVSESAIAFAFRHADETGQPLTAVHAWTEPLTPTSLGTAMPALFDPDVYARDQQILLAESLAGWSEKFPEVPVSRQVVNEQPVRALASIAEGAALLVVGCRGLSAVRTVLLGSVSHGVLHLATCPVAVVHDHA